MSKKFLSISTGEPCGGPHYIAELLVTRQAKKDKKALPYKFWNTPEWKKQYKLQMMGVQTLLRLYSELAIINALQSQKGKNIYSIRCPWLDELIEEAEKKLQQKPEVIEILDKVEQPKKEIAPSFGKKTNISKLRELDG
jgi:hypothetical protein